MVRHPRAVAAIVLAAFASFVLSVSMWFSGDREQGVFVGLWVPSIIALGAFVLSTLEPGHRGGTRRHPEG